MTYYALKDSDWAFDDRDEGRAIIVQADTPEEAISKATEMHIKEYPGAGGVTWDVARLDLTGIGDAEWEDDNKPKFEPFRFYAEGSNEPSETYKRMKILEAKNAALTARVNGFEGFLDDLAEILGCERDIGDVVDELDAINNRAEALETQLAAATDLLRKSRQSLKRAPYDLFVSMDTFLGDHVDGTKVIP